MGAIAKARGALPVSSLARNMGLVRQSVQRIVDELTTLGLLRLASNPHHRCAKLLQFTDRGAALFEEVNARWLAIADALLASIGLDEAKRGAAFLQLLRDRVEASHPMSADDPTPLQDEMSRREKQLAEGQQHYCAGLPGPAARKDSARLGAEA